MQKAYCKAKKNEMLTEADLLVEMLCITAVADERARTQLLEDTLRLHELQQG